MRFWFYEATEGLSHDDPATAIAQSLAGLALTVEALRRHLGKMQTATDPDLGPPDVMETVAAKGIALAILTSLGEMDEHLQRLKGTAAWRGQLADLGPRYRAAYGGKVKTARDAIQHLAAHILEERPHHQSLKDTLSPVTGIRYKSNDLLVGIQIFGRDYDLAHVLAAARALAPDMASD